MTHGTPIISLIVIGFCHSSCCRARTGNVCRECFFRSNESESSRLESVSSVSCFCPKDTRLGWEIFHNNNIPGSVFDAGWPCRSRTIQTSPSSRPLKTSSFSLQQSQRSQRSSPNSTKSQMCCGHLAPPNIRPSRYMVYPRMPHVPSGRSRRPI